MCITFFLWDCSEDLKLLVAFNRDEAFERSTQVAHWWPDKPLLGGRDELAGGTWLCISPNGRVSWLTNYWEKGCLAPRNEGPSRGELPVRFVEGEDAPLDYLASVEKDLYPGFNLMCVDLRTREAAYLCNRGPGAPEPVPPGLHGITNGRLNARSWVKLEEGKRALQGLLEGGVLGRGEVPWAEVFRVMSDDRVLERDPAKLPTSCAHAPGLTVAAGSIFVKPFQSPMGLCGTRSQIVLAVRRDGTAELRERYRSGEGDWRQVVHTFRVQLDGPPLGGCGETNSGRAEMGSGGVEASGGGPEANGWHAVSV